MTAPTGLSCPPLAPRVGALGLLDNWLDGWAVAATGILDCLATALTEGPAALDIPRWVELSTSRRRPRWSSPHEVVLEAPLARLRDFSTAKPRGLVPTIVLPPQAGHDSCIVDYSAQQSQMRTIIAAGLTHALSLDWIGATAATRDAGIQDHLQVVDDAIDHVGGFVNLIGDCQGGWLAAIYAALNPERVNTLTLAGAPIDFHAGDPLIGEALQRLSPGGDLRFYETLVRSGGGVLKGEHMLSGFIMLKPGDEISRQLDLLAKLDDATHVERYREFEDWFKHTQDLPGAFYLWIVRHLFRDNELVLGQLEIGGRRVDLQSLAMPLHLLAGAADHISPPDQVFAIADHASTTDELVRRDVVPGGHLGLFMGHQSLREYWPPMLRHVLRRSV